jgi:glucose-1-phosphate thymidylyltransferase
MMLAGIRDIVIVSDPAALPQFRTLIGDGSQWGVNVEYCAQERPAGIADGFRVAADALRGSNIALMLGDNILYGSGLPHFLRDGMAKNPGATVFCAEVADPSSFGIVEFDAAGKPVSLVEKPAKPKSRLAVIGLYFYTPDVIDVAAGIRPSARGELEITDVNAEYLKQGRLAAIPFGRGYAWLDGGTTENLFEAAQFVRVMEERTGMKISCPEEIAWRYKLITRDKAAALAEAMPASEYKRYLLRTLEESPLAGNNHS